MPRLSRVYTAAEATATSRHSTPIQSRAPALRLMRPMPTTPLTETRLNSSCPPLGFSRRMGAAARVDTMGIMAIITPEKMVVECRMPYCSPRK